MTITIASVHSCVCCMQTPFMRSPVGLLTAQDEVLSHRLGLVPIRADPDLFESKAGQSAESSCCLLHHLSSPSIVGPCSWCRHELCGAELL